MSINDISEHLYQQHGYKPSKHVVFNWVDKYTSQAAKHFRDYKPHVGDKWVVDETMIDLDNHKVWFWDVIDTETRFLLASRVSETRTTQDAQIVMEQAATKAGKAPKQVLSDGLAAYLDGIELAFGGNTEHVQGSPFNRVSSTSQIERFHSTLKERTKVMRAFRNTETLLQFADGFLAFYNFMRPNEALKGKTPAEAAKIDYTAKTWGQLVRLPVPKGGGRRELRLEQVSEPEYHRPKAQSVRKTLGKFAGVKVRPSKAKPSKARRVHRVLADRLRPMSITTIRG